MDLLNLHVIIHTRFSTPVVVERPLSPWSPSIHPLLTFLRYVWPKHTRAFFLRSMTLSARGVNSQSLISQQNYSKNSWKWVILACSRPYPRLMVLVLTILTMTWLAKLTSAYSQPQVWDEWMMHMNTLLWYRGGLGSTDIRYLLTARQMFTIWILLVARSHEVLFQCIARQNSMPSNFSRPHIFATLSAKILLD